MITYKDFQKLDIRIGTILEAESVPETDKLIKLRVDVGLKPSVQSTDGSPEHSPETNVLGERDIRTIVAGIREFIPDPKTLIGLQIPILTNLEHREIKGILSEGMILACLSDAHSQAVSNELEGAEGPAFSLLHPSVKIKEGSRVR